MYSEKCLENFIKLLRNPVPVTLQTFFTRRALKGHLDTQEALEGDSKSTLRALNTQGTRALEGHLGIRALIRNLGTRRVLGHLGIRALRHSRHLI